MKTTSIAVTFLASIATLVGQELSTFDAHLIYQQPPSLLREGYAWSDGVLFTHADDFSVPEATTIPIVTWWGIEAAQSPTDQFTLRIYSGDDQRPGAVLLDLTPAEIDKVYAGQGLFRYSVNLPTPFAADAGQRYWLSIVNPPYRSWGWWISDSTQNESIAYTFEGGPWTPSYAPNLAFALGVVPEPNPLALLLVGIGVLGCCRLLGVRGSC